MSEFRISNEQAKLLAVGLYKSAVDYIVTAKRDNHDDYEQFAADYRARQAADTPQVKRRQSHKCSDNPLKVKEINIDKLTQRR